MGKRKFRLSVHRKNEERKKVKNKERELEVHPMEQVTPATQQESATKCLTISIPLHFFTESHISTFTNLHSRISSLMTSPFFISSHPSWKVVWPEPLTLCKLKV